jgi:hypothetical protein
MWSGFMEIDEAKASSSRAERRLEKPFDAETLRSLVRDLVPSLGNNAIAEFLSFPEMPEMIEDGRKAPQDEPEEIQLGNFEKTTIQRRPTAPSKPAAVDPFPSLDEIEEIEEPEEFQSVPLPKNQGLPPQAQPAKPTPKEDWARQDLSKYRIELPQEDEFPMDDDLTNTSIALSSGLEEISLEDLDDPEPKPRPKGRPTAPASQKAPPASKTFSMPSEADRQLTPLSALDPMRAEELLRQEARSVLETVAWKLLPEIVERVVREELQKLLKDAERL